jgi:hypothetical protein
VITNPIDQIRPVGPDATAFEFSTTLRGRQVSCRLVDGELRGDPELLARLHRFFPDDTDLSAITVAHRVRDAVGSDVVIRLVEGAA